MFFFGILFLTPSKLSAQAANEIQVHASPTIGNHRTIIELHTNNTIEGNKFLPEPTDANWTNLTVEVTHGFDDNFEIGMATPQFFPPNRRPSRIFNIC